MQKKKHITNKKEESLRRRARMWLDRIDDESMLESAVQFLHETYLIEKYRQYNMQIDDDPVIVNWQDFRYLAGSG